MNPQVIRATIRINIALSLSAFFGMPSLAPAISIEPQIGKGASGLNYVLFEDQKRPLFEVNLIFKFGTADDPKGKSGTAHLLSRILDRGTRGLSQSAFHSQLERLGARWVTLVEEDYFSVSMKGFSNHIEELSILFIECVFYPRFDAEEFLTQKERVVEQYHLLVTQPNAWFAWLFERWSKQGTRYHRGPLAGLKEFQKISLQDLEDYASYALNPKHALLLAVGKISAPELLRIYKNLLTHWPKPKDQENAVAKFAPPREFTTPYIQQLSNHDHDILIFDRKDTSHSEIRRSFNLKQISWKERAAISIVETLLSGTFNSRLNKRLRDELGLVYQVGVSLEGAVSDAQIQFEAGTQAIHAGVVLQESDQIFAEIAKKGPRIDEVEFSKQFLLGSFPIGLASLSGVAVRYASGWLYGNPLGFLDQYLEFVRGFDTYEVSKIIKPILSKHKFKTAIFGNADLLKRSLAARGYSRVFIVDAAAIAKHGEF